MDISQPCRFNSSRPFEGVKNVWTGVLYLLKKQFVWLQKPSSPCGIDDVCGFICPGYDADFIVVTKRLAERDVPLRKERLQGLSSRF